MNNGKDVILSNVLSSICDKKDFLILHELDRNARASYSEIGKKTRCSPEVAFYRVKKLEEAKIITQYQLMINLAKLGIIQFKIYLKLQHITSAKLEEIINSFKSKPEIKWIVSCSGTWDLLLALETLSISQVERLTNEVLTQSHGFVHTHAVSILTRASVLNRGYLAGKKDVATAREVYHEAEPVAIDALERKILIALSANARSSIMELSRKLKTTPRTIMYRIKGLVDKQIITGYKIALNYEKLGVKFYKLNISIDNPNSEGHASLTRYLARHPNALTFVTVLGGWQLEPEFEVFSEKEFQDILTDLKDRFHDIIKQVDVITITKEHKFVYY